MKSLLLSVALLSACAVTPQEIDWPEPPADVERAAALNLYEVRLGAGSHGSINVGWIQRNGAELYLDPRTWLAQGYDGVRIIGEGSDATEVRCTAWDGITVAIGRHDGVVELARMTIHAGYSNAVFSGQENTTGSVKPRFKLRMVDDVKVEAPPPQSAAAIEAAISAGRASAGDTTDRLQWLRARVQEESQRAALGAVTIRTKWLVFSYNCDLYFRGVTFVGKEAVEHDVYAHGYAQNGADVQDCTFESSGAEGFKTRSSANETAWAGPRTWIILRNCTFRDWYQPWSWRGGAAIVIQGGASNVFVERCVFWGGTAAGDIPANNRSRAIMVSSEGNSYDRMTGAVGAGFGNDYVIVRDCALYGFSDVDWSNTLMRVGKNGTHSQMAARGLLVERSGLWGQRMIVQTDNIPAGAVLFRGTRNTEDAMLWCNSQTVRSWCNRAGMDTTFEARFTTAARLVPVSEGIAR